MSSSAGSAQKPQARIATKIVVATVAVLVAVDAILRSLALPGPGASVARPQNVAGLGFAGGAAPGGGARSRGRRPALLALVLLLAIALIVVVIALASGGTATTARPAVQPTAATVTVTRRDLAVNATVSGTLNYGAPQTVLNRLGGKVTSLPRVGQVVSAGQPLFSVGRRAVVLLYGTTPAHRALRRTDNAGADVHELNANLAALGYSGGGKLVVDDTWQPATTAGVKALEGHLGEAQTGTLALGEVVFLPTAQIVRSRAAPTGAGTSKSSAVTATAATTTATTTTATPATTATTATTTTPTATATTATATHTATPTAASAPVSRRRPELGRRDSTTSTTVTFTSTATTVTATPPTSTAPPPSTGTTTTSGPQPVQTSTATLTTPTSPTKQQTIAQKKKQQQQALKAEQQAAAQQAAQLAAQKAAQEAAQRAAAQRNAAAPSSTTSTIKSPTTTAPRKVVPRAVLTTSSADLFVTVRLSPQQRSQSRVGQAVNVRLPGGVTVPGSVTRVSSTTPQSPVVVRVDFTKPLLGSGLSQAGANVTVSVAVRTARGVLSIPRSALISPASGGPAVEAAYPSVTRLPVTAGLVAGGYVQISGPGIHPGLRLFADGRPPAPLHRAQIGHGTATGHRPPVRPKRPTSQHERL